MSVVRIFVGLTALAMLMAVPANAERGEGTYRLKKKSVTSVIRIWREPVPHSGESGSRKRTLPLATPAETKPEQPLVYRPESLETLRTNAFAVLPPPADSLAAAILAELSNPQSPIRVAPGEKTIVLDFYRANGFKPLWTTPDGLTPRAQAILAFLAASEEDAMEPSDYLPPLLSSFEDDPQAYRGDLAHLARLDLGLTAMALKYARHASAGRLIPNRLSGYYDIEPVRIDPLKVMKVMTWSPFPVEYLKSLQPQHPAYAKFKAGLAEKRESIKTDGDPIAKGPKLKPGKADPRVAALRHRLVRLGYDVSAPSDSNDSVFDETLVAALKAFQKDARLKDTGVLDAPATMALNNRSDRRDRDRLIYAMERLRWLPRDLGERYVFVNQPAYQLRFVERGREIWRTKVIVGKPENQTVAFHDTMETVVFNPSWGVPQSIVRNEMLPILVRDPGYLDRLGFRVMDKAGRIVKSRSVDWPAFGKTIPFAVQQPPGDDNALGDIKFLFPNRHDIYMHDTPTKALFSRDIRALSHGCVRVENPRRFGELVLGWTAEQIAARIESGESTSVRVKKPLSVHLVYFTAWPDGDGKIAYFDDVYGRDRRMEEAFGTIPVASR